MLERFRSLRLPVPHVRVRPLTVLDGLPEALVDAPQQDCPALGVEVRADLARAVDTHRDPAKAKQQCDQRAATEERERPGDAVQDSQQHQGTDAAITGGFVYHGTQFPASYQGSYFFADYTQNWIRRLTFDAQGNVNGVFNFEPADGSVDGPYGDIVYLTEGPDGALYYVDLGYSDVGGTFGVSMSSSAANPTHTYTQAGVYSVRLSVSDGVNPTLSQPMTITVGSPPTATILSPQDGGLFRAGDVISFSGEGNDPDDGALPASAFTWNIDFLHEGHVHPGPPIVGVKSGTFTIPTTGHDFSGFTRYRITLTVTDSNGLSSTQSVTVFPQKVNLTFDTVPSGRTLNLDGIAKTTPFVYDTLIGFNHTIEARNQTSGNNTYTFGSWSDGGAQLHTIVVPETAQTYTATYSVSSALPIAFVQVKSATPQTAQSTVATAFPQAQTAGDLNAVVIGWNESAGNITSVSDSAGNVYQVGAGSGSQASSGTATTNFASRASSCWGRASPAAVSPLPGPASPLASSPAPTRTSPRTGRSAAPGPTAPQPPRAAAGSCR
jgi:PKD repeat protein